MPLATLKEWGHIRVAGRDDGSFCSRQADTIDKYNRDIGFETRHVLIGIVHFEDTVP